METMDRPIRVFVVDDHDAYRRVAGAVIDATPGFELAGEAADAATATALLALDAPGTDPAVGDEADLVLVDVNLGATSGIDLAARLTSTMPGLRVALISTLGVDELPPEATSCGAFAFLPKDRLGPGSLEDLEAGLYDWRR